MVVQQRVRPRKGEQTPAPLSSPAAAEADTAASAASSNLSAYGVNADADGQLNLAKA